MPVMKYRSIEEMPDTRWYEPGDPELFAAIRCVWGFTARAFPRRLPPGVYKHRSSEAARAQADAWEHSDRERLRQARERRASG